MSADMQDIREWARANGWDIADKGRLAEPVKAAYAAATAQPETPAEPAYVSEPTWTVPEPITGTVVPERKPDAPKKESWLARQRKKQADRPRPGHKRVSIENVLSTGWAFGAMALARSPQAIPVARIMDMQAPVAGVIGEELLKGTVVDRLLQPIARGGRKAELGVALAGPPLLVGIMTAQPKLFPVLRPMLKMTMMSWMEISEPAARKVEKRAAQWAEKFGDVDLDAMIDLLWQDMPVPSEQEEENIRKAREQ